MLRGPGANHPNPGLDMPSPNPILRIKQLFLEASDLPEEQWKAFVDASGEDPAIQERVLAQLRRLKADEDVAIGQGLEGRGGRDPDQVGPYRILRRIGEGGMGVVYLAEQDQPVVRTVALKRIRPGMDSDAVLRRFERERQALASMDHPNIAKVYDAGMDDDGRPYVVMEYIDGRSLSDWCDGNSLRTEDRIELFIKVCHGVQHAHQRGVLHRDLKPTNVIVAEVDGKPVPKIIDFGLAKATGDGEDALCTSRSLHTQMGVLLGTPEYMSPEQADPQARDIDTRSDVYSLGVIFYELISGLMPFDSEQLREQGLAGILRTLRTQTPAKPSTRVSTMADGHLQNAQRRRLAPRALMVRLRGDLDWIALRALEGDREQRYASPMEFAADLARHLSHEPVQAGPPTAGYRLRKFMRRYRLQVGAASVVLGSLVTGLAFSISFGLEARAQYQEAEDARRRVSESARILEREKAATEFARNQAKENARLARGQQEQADLARSRAEQARWEAERAARFVTRMLGYLDPNVLQTPGFDVNAFLRSTVEEAEQELADQPSMLATVLTDVGRALWTRGRAQSARAYLYRALELRDADPGSTPEQFHAVLVPAAWNDWHSPATSTGGAGLWRRSLKAARAYACTAVPELERPIREILSGLQWSEPYYLDINVKLDEILSLASGIPEGDPRWVAIGDLTLAIGDYSSRLAIDRAFAQRAFQHAREIFVQRAGLPRSHTRLALVREMQLHALYRQVHRSGAYDEGAMEAEEAYLDLLKIVPPGHWHASIFRAVRASMLRRAGVQESSVLELLEPAVTHLLATLGPYSPALRDPLLDLVEILDELGERERASVFREALVAGGPSSPRLRFMQAALGAGHSEVLETIAALLAYQDDAAVGANEAEVSALLHKLFDTCARDLSERPLQHEAVCRWTLLWARSRLSANAFGTVSVRRPYYIATFRPAELLDAMGVSACGDFYAEAAVQAPSAEEALLCDRKAVEATTRFGTEANLWVRARYFRRQSRSQEAIAAYYDAYHDKVFSKEVFNWEVANPAYQLQRILLLEGLLGEAASFSETHLTRLLRGGALPQHLNVHAWALARLPDLEHESYRLAKRASCEAIGGMEFRMGRNPAPELRRALMSFQVTLGVLHYRLGENQQATVVLKECERMSHEFRSPSLLIPAFLALAQERLGDAEGVRRSLAELRRWNDEETDTYTEAQRILILDQVKEELGGKHSWGAGR